MLNPMRLGKTSLMTRILHYAKQHGVSTVSLSFQQADNKVFADIDQFLRWFCLSVTRKLNLPADKVTSRWMDFLGAKDNSQVSRWMQCNITYRISGAAYRCPDALT
ncbi:MAG: AAA-like domain-containing protein [Pseudomonadota bacterium]